MLIGTCCVRSSTSIQLITKANSKLSPKQLQDFISRPSNWPQIVASSNRVEPSSTLPLQKGGVVREYFGLNLLSVDWTCKVSEPGCLIVESPLGLDQIADRCSMRFDFLRKDGENDSDDDEKYEVRLTMAYNPLSPIALLATPILIVDNWLALNVLLPAAVDPDPLNSFRVLMGQLYGIAGLAHLADLLVGNSSLLVAAGIPVYAELTPFAKAYAWLWCAAGPLSYWATSSAVRRRMGPSSLLADGSLAFYGLIEIGGVYLGSGTFEALINAVAVQGIVVAAWIYSSKKNENR